MTELLKFVFLLALLEINHPQYMRFCSLHYAFLGSSVWRVSAILRALLGPSGPPWALLGPLGPSWALLGPPGPFWGLLGPSWALLGHPGPLWALLGPFGPSWALWALLN